MNLRTYHLAICDTGGDLLTMLDLTGAQMFRARLELNAFGALQVTFPLSLWELEYTAIDNLIHLYVNHNERDDLDLWGTYFLRDYTILQDENQLEWITISGYGLEHLYYRRIFHIINISGIL